MVTQWLERYKIVGPIVKKLYCALLIYLQDVENNTKELNSLLKK